MKKSRINKLKTKLRACFQILFGHRHWFMVSLDTENLKKLISEDDFRATVLYHGLVKYNVDTICKKNVDGIDEIDWILEKAKFEAEAEYHKNK
jgi:hypothetical protein